MEETVTLISSKGKTSKASTKLLKKHSRLIEALLATQPLSSLSLTDFSHRQISRLVRLLQLCEQNKFHPDGALFPENYSDTVPRNIDEFLNADHSFLLDLLTLADFLQITLAKEIVSTKIATLVQGKPVERVMNMFGVENDQGGFDEEYVKKFRTL